jgi:predicted nucleotidyltransferase
MDQNIDSAIAKYLQLVRDKYADLECAYVFGSFAKGYASDESDIDLALIFSQLDGSQRFDTQVQLMLLASKIDSRIEPHPLSHEDFYSENPFIHEIKKTGYEVTN